MGKLLDIYIDVTIHANVSCFRIVEAFNFKIKNGGWPFDGDQLEDWMVKYVFKL